MVPGVGRPEIGPAFSVRFPEDLLERIDAASASVGVSRASRARTDLSVPGLHPGTPSWTTIVATVLDRVAHRTATEIATRADLGALLADI